MSKEINYKFLAEEVIKTLDPQNIISDKKNLVVEELAKYYYEEDLMVSTGFGQEMIENLFRQHSKNLSDLIGNELFKKVFQSNVFRCSDQS